MRVPRPIATLSLLPLLPLAALAAPFPSALVPLLGWSSPSPFLGLDDGFSKPIGLEFSDFELLPRGNGSVFERYEEGKTKVREEDAVEGTVAAWARGWRKTCGKGEANKEVRVAKVLVDGVAEDAERSEWATALDAHLTPYLDSLPPPPHNSVTLLTSLSPSTLLSLFDLASPPPSSPSPHNPPSIPARRKHAHGVLYRLAAALFSLALKALLLLALFVLGKRFWVRYKAWKAAREGAEGVGRVRLGDDELNLDLGSEDEEEGEGEAPWRIGGRADGR
ncbi:hypothetical protein AAT19DRAFT_13550 [Rhodotorula toruloides]|uniref:Uncharacterized protein n=1 Tax=Rhodotorula toruloides TaxID=5286 RepID=A0A2T0ABX3_RHOTO|nr:hypothetical protein AAT19DRAFT_13550 [Rhodotorula toruloides]